MCCKVLEIEDFDKPAGPWCAFCVPGGGCKAYETRPDTCRDFACLWKGDRGLTPMLRPDRVGTILMEDAYSQDYLAVCDPAKPFAWRTPLVFNHLVLIAKSGRTVLAKAGTKAWRIHGSGQWGPCA
jgi:hypothetical protein